jgi:aryl-alcohol dehydrogenase-like predicted oxidoreductase
VAEVPGWRPGEVALAYVLGNPAVDCAIVGTVDERHLEENVAASHRPLPPELRRRIDAV